MKKCRTAGAASLPLDLIKSCPMTRLNPDKDVQPTDQHGVCNETSAINSPEGAFLGSVYRENREIAPVISQHRKSSNG